MTTFLLQQHDYVHWIFILFSYFSPSYEQFIIQYQFVDIKLMV
jgi:hypothetical protein